jgi:hypothetical protein
MPSTLTWNCGWYIDAYRCGVRERLIEGCGDADKVQLLGRHCFVDQKAKAIDCVGGRHSQSVVLIELGTLLQQADADVAGGTGSARYLTSGVMTDDFMPGANEKTVEFC